MAWMVGGERGLALVNDRSQGCSSLRDGELEFMVHRRLLHDDGKGVGEALDEPGTDGEGLTVTGTHHLLLASAARLAAEARAKALRVFAPVEPLFAVLNGSVADYIKGHLVNASALALDALPANVELMTVQLSDAEKVVVLLRLAHQFGVGEDAQLSAAVTVDVASLFGFKPTNVVELSLTANQAKGAHKGYTWHVQGEQRGKEAAREEHSLVFQPGQSYNITIQPAEIRSQHATASPPCSPLWSSLPSYPHR